MNLRQAKLMLKLAGYLHDFKEPKKGEPGMGFDMKSFYATGYWLFYDHRPHPCGTSACAMGHAATMPCFQRLGLRLIKDVGYLGGIVFKTPGVRRRPLRNFEAIDHIFGITLEESLHLFDAHDRTAKQESAVLRQFVYKRFPQLKPVAKKPTKKKAVKK